MADDHPRWAAALYNKCGTCEQWIKAEYNDQGAIIDTWGLIGTMTWAAVAKYASPPNGELYVVLSEDWIDRASGRAPNGFDFATLQADLAGL